jgi:predicted NBD/HSP70 family sugar kinase
MIEDKFSLPVILTNTSMAKIHAIDRLEVEGNPNNLMYIEYGEGIGCGLKLAGNYITGQHYLAGELGHVRVTDKPISCRCGGIGCLESVAALPAITNNAISAIKENTNSILNSSTNITGISVLEAASKGDRLASHIVDEAFDYLGRAVAGIVNIVNPEIIVFDNIISKAGEQAVATLIRSLQKNTLSTHWKDIKTHICKIDSFIGTLGGAATVLDECLEY